MTRRSAMSVVESAGIAGESTRSIVWDNHGCMPLRPGDDVFLPQLERYRQSGVNVVSLNVGFDGTPWTHTLQMLAHFRHWVALHRDRYSVVTSVGDIQLAVEAGKLAITFDIEGGCALADQLSLVQLYYDLGVRWMLIAYNRNNALGGGCQDEDTGLTAFGCKVIDEMERVGMVVCCSHTGYQTTMDVMQRARTPVIFSHSNPLGVWRHRRNIRDDAIRACASTGGVVGINGIGTFLGDNDASTKTIVRHIDYVAQLVGVAHVGLGLDYVFDQAELHAYLRDNPVLFPASDGYGGPQEAGCPEQIPEIAEALMTMGYSEQDVRCVLGENHLRVARQTWK